MEFGKKFILTPEEGWTKHAPTPQQLSEFDQEMSRVLNNKKLTDAEKVQQYTQILQQKLNIIEHNVPWKPAENVSKPVDYDSLIMESIPQNMKKHTKNLLALLKNHPQSVAWNDKGEAILKGQTIANSHIVDLMNMLVANTEKNMAGKDVFLSTLDELNVPKNFIKNRFLQPKPTPKSEFETSIEETPSPQNKKRKKRKYVNPEAKKTTYVNNDVPKWLKLK